MTSYPKPSLTADAVVITGHGSSMRLLLVRRKKAPYQSAWAFPGGFAAPFELPLDAAIRECREETGIHLSSVDAIPLELRVREGRDPRGWTITQPYLFWVEHASAAAAGDDAQQAQWVKLDDLNRLAFDHGAILCEAIGRFWPMMPSFCRRLSGVAPWGGPPGKTDELVFFGGSFNPWHAGHDACVSAFSGPGQLIIVPDRNPEKAPAALPCYWSALRDICRAVETRDAHVFPGFFGLERSNPTVKWLPLVDTARRGLLLGADSLVSLPQWIRADNLVKALDSIDVVPRNVRATDIAEARSWIQSMNPHCVLRVLPDHPYQHVSSSALRLKGNRSD